MHTYWYSPFLSVIAQISFWAAAVLAFFHFGLLQPCSSSISIHDKCDIYDLSGRYRPRGEAARQRCSGLTGASHLKQYALTAAGHPRPWFTFNFHCRWAVRQRRRPRPKLSTSQSDSIHFTVCVLTLWVKRCHVIVQRGILCRQVGTLCQW